MTKLVTTQEKKKELIGKCITKLGKSTTSQISVNKISDDLGEKKALIGECITKLGKSTASQMPVDKISDNSGEKKGIDRQVHNQIRQVNSKSDASQQN